MKHIASLFASLFIFVSAFTTAFAAETPVVATTDNSGIQVFTMLAGQTLDSGDFTVEVNGNNLAVTYSTVDGWTLNEVHLWIGEYIADMPQTRKGQPIPGQFPYVSGDIKGATSYSFSIPLDVLNFSCPSENVSYLVAAHASVSKLNADGSVQNETAWSNGARFSERGNWATYSTFELACQGIVTPPVTEGRCETAFAYAPAPEGTCFLNIDEDGDSVGDFNRWGWTIGPLQPGVHTYEVYAGAGQCDLSKGIYVGLATVDYNGAEATVTFSDVANPNYLKEIHVYVGNEILPRKKGFFTVAPGQYTEINESPAPYGDGFTIAANGDIYVVAHATVCGFPEK